MKTFSPKNNPTIQRPFFRQEEIEELCLAELKKADLLPAKPEPIRIDRFIEIKFGISPIYEDLEDGILGFTKFGKNGVEKVYVTSSLDEEGTVVAERRVRTTLAHEAGHGLLHAHLFVLGKGIPTLFNNEQPDEPTILCREVASIPTSSNKYDGRWWEYQANKAMGCLLLPKPLVEIAIAKFFKSEGLLGAKKLGLYEREEAVTELSEIFDVNPIVARLRLEELYPLTDLLQRSL